MIGPFDLDDGNIRTDFAERLDARDAGLAEAIARVVGSAELRQRLGEAAQESMKRYTWENSARLLEDLFYRVLAHEGAGSTAATRKS